MELIKAVDTMTVDLNKVSPPFKDYIKYYLLSRLNIEHYPKCVWKLEY